MDPIADMFTILRSAKGAGKDKAVFNYSKVKLAILEILKNHKQIRDYRILEKKNAKDTKEIEHQKIEVDISHETLFNITRISTPGQRVYSSSKKIPRPKRQRAIIIISTPQGILEGEEARKKGLGGEVMAELR